MGLVIYILCIDFVYNLSVHGLQLEIFYKKLHNMLSKIAIRHMSSRNLLNLYERHGFISNHYPREKGHDIAAYLEKDQRTIYAGFDPTAPSLHIGNLMVICGLLHAQKAGHKTIGILNLNLII